MAELCCPQNSYADVLTQSTSDCKCLVIRSLKWWVSYSEASRVGSKSIWNLDTERDTRNMLTQRKDHVRTQKDGGHTQAKEQGLWRNQTCWQPDLGLLASGIVENEFLLFKQPSLWSFVVIAQPKQDTFLSAARVSEAKDIGSIFMYCPRPGIFWKTKKGRWYMSGLTFYGVVWPF